MILCVHCFSPVFKHVEFTYAACVSTALALSFNMLRDIDAACVSTALTLCLNMLSELMVLVWPLPYPCAWWKGGNKENESSQDQGVV